MITLIEEASFFRPIDLELSHDVVIQIRGHDDILELLPSPDQQCLLRIFPNKIQRILFKFLVFNDQEVKLEVT